MVYTQHLSVLNACKYFIGTNVLVSWNTDSQCHLSVFMFQLEEHVHVANVSFVCI